MTLISSAPDGMAAGAELVPQVGHMAGPTSVAFAPDGGTALSCGYDGMLKLWDIAGGRLLRTIAADKSRVSCVAFSPDGRTALSGGSDKALRLWKLATGELIRTFAAGRLFQPSDALAGHSGGVNAVAFSADGRSAISGGDDNAVKLWDVASAQVLATFHHGIGVVHCIAWSPDNQIVVSDGGLSHGSLSLWDIASRSLLRTFEVDDAVSAVAFSPDGSALLAAGSSALTLWDVAGGKLLRTFCRQLFAKFTSVAFLPCGRTVLSAHLGGLTLWDVESAEALRHFDGEFCVAVSPDGLTALSRSAEGALALWNLASGELLKTFGSRSFRSAAVSPDGRSVLTSHDREPGLRLWDVMNARLLRTFGPVYPSCLAFSPDGRAVAAISIRDRCLKLWDVSSGDKSWEADEASYSFSAVFSQGGRHILCEGPSSLQLRDAATGQLLRQCSTPDPRNVIAVSPDAASVLSANYDSTVELWDLQSSELRHSFRHGLDRQDVVAASADIAAVLLAHADKPWNRVSEELRSVFSAHGIPANYISAPQNDGQIFVHHVNGRMSYWDMASGGLADGQPNMSVTCGAFSPDARTVLTGSEDGTLKLWDVVSGKLLTTYIGHGSVKHAAFSPTGGTVLSANLDGTMTLWNTASGQLLQSFPGHGGEVLAIAFSADGHTIRSTTADGMLRLWNASDGALIATFFTLGHEGAVVFTPAGHFATSAARHKALAIVCGTDALPIEEFIASHRRRSLAEI